MDANACALNMHNIDIADACVAIAWHETPSLKSWTRQLTFLRGAVLLKRQADKWGKLGVTAEARLKSDIKLSIFYAYFTMAQKVFKQDGDQQAGDDEQPPPVYFSCMDELAVSKTVVQGLQVYAKQLRSMADGLIEKLSQCTQGRHSSGPDSWKHGLAGNASCQDIKTNASSRLDCDVSGLQSLMDQLTEAPFAMIPQYLLLGPRS